MWNLAVLTVYIGCDHLILFFIKSQNYAVLIVNWSEIILIIRLIKLKLKW